MKKSIKNKYVSSKGKSLPGVTTVLQVLNKPALIQWAWEMGKQGIDWRKVRDTRAGIGTLVHDMIECELTNQPSPNLDKYSVEDIEIALKCKNHFDLWKARQKDFEVIDVELVMASDAHKFGGTCDLYYKSQGKYILMDFKTSKACYDEHKIQQCAYKLLLEEQGKQVDEIKLFQLHENKTGVVPIKKNLIQAYTDIFLGALEVYKAQKALEVIDGRSKAKSTKFRDKKTSTETVGKKDWSL